MNWRTDPMSVEQRAAAYIDSTSPFRVDMTREEKRDIFAAELAEFGHACAAAAERERDEAKAQLAQRPAWPPMRPMSEPPTEERPEAFELLFLRADGEFELGPGPQFGVEYLGWWPLPEVPR